MFFGMPKLPLPPVQATCTTFFRRRNSRLESQFRTKITIYTMYILNLKKQLKVQIIIILEEIDFFYWPKMHFLKICQKIGQGPPTPLIRAMPECIEKYIPTGEQKTFD